MNPDQNRQSNYKIRNIHNLENKLTRFQTYPETELACKYNKPLYKTQYSEIPVKCERSFDMNTGKLIIYPHATYYSTSDKKSYIPVHLLQNTGNNGAKIKPQDKDTTRLRGLSLMNNTQFGAIHYEIQLGMKSDYTISRIFSKNVFNRT